MMPLERYEFRDTLSLSIKIEFLIFGGLFCYFMWSRPRVDWMLWEKVCSVWKSRNKSKGTGYRDASRLVMYDCIFNAYRNQQLLFLSYILAKGFVSMLHRQQMCAHGNDHILCQPQSPVLHHDDGFVYIYIADDAVHPREFSQSTDNNMIFAVPFLAFGLLAGSAIASPPQLFQLVSLQSIGIDIDTPTNDVQTIALQRSSHDLQH